ncbi:hypothetical protein [Haloferula sp.]|uniref:hypothetical protein n=1 Tax=Haloferula sp. TaxID=2497595 RepID=UPI00329BCF30
MNPGLLIIGLILVVAQLALPLRWAFVAILVAACHTPAVQVVGDFSVTRMVIIVGLMRAMSCGRFTWSAKNPLDLLVAIWAFVALISSFAHSSGSQNPLMFRCGLVLDVGGAYLYARAYLTGEGVLQDLVKGLVVVLVPFALLMLVEQFTGKNPYAGVGARLVTSLVREGTTRATGPFGTPILAGTVGGSSLPLMFILWNENRRMAIVGIVSCISIVLCSGSSGPIATAGIGCMAMFAWRFRESGKLILWGGVIAVIIMQQFRERRVWYLMTLMDFVGGSTGWHRARLIDAAYEHLGEWWFLGTDYTRDWMPYGLPEVPEHCDLTNYYILFGVVGGLPLMLSLVAILWKSIKLLVDRISEVVDYDESQGFFLWCVASVLIAHSITFLSISYFDQIYVFFWMLIGGISAFLVSGDEEEDDEEEEEEPEAIPSRPQFG